MSATRATEHFPTALPPLEVLLDSVITAVHYKSSTVLIVLVFGLIALCQISLTALALAAVATGFWATLGFKLPTGSLIKRETSLRIRSTDWFFL